MDRFAYTRPAPTFDDSPNGDCCAVVIRSTQAHIGPRPDPERPASFTIHQFVVKVGGYGGTMVVETESAADVHYVTSVFAAFEFGVKPVMDGMDAGAVEMKAIEFLKKNAA
ncbi:MAG TPA: DUF3303 family protein [Acidobacteriaceae bacterium]|nr:DUF3303 family protein [Acidobacteriaceae bacterium]